MSEELKCFVKVSTDVQFDGGVLRAEKRFSVLQAKSTINMLLDLCDNFGAGDALLAITKTLDIDDGVYELVTHVSKDQESGIIDDWHHELVAVEVKP